MMFANKSRFWRLWHRGWQGTALSLTGAGFLQGALVTASVQADSPFLEKLGLSSSNKTELNRSQDRAIKKKSFKEDMLGDFKPIPNKELGIFAEVTDTTNGTQEAIRALLSDPRTNGISVLLPWSQLEPTEGHFDWHGVDNLLELCKSANKSLILRVSTCGVDASADAAPHSAAGSGASAAASSASDTPNWVFEAGTKYLAYQGKDGHEHKMPIFWDATYLAKWSNFVQEMGSRYDKNPYIHSVGITGGGLLGGTGVVPDFGNEKDNYAKLEEELKTKHDMSQRQLISHWKYAADLFPKAFPTARLNFDIDPPTHNKAGQDSLDEISDYLVFRYGQRIFITRQNVASNKHGFDDYRVLLRFKNDTYSGYRLADQLSDDDWDKLTKNALDDGISFIEVPAKFMLSENEKVKEALSRLNEHLGYQLVLREAKFERDIKDGDNLKASITFVNVGSSTPKSPNRQLDKDVPSSYQVGFELKDGQGKPVLISAQTPPVSTTNWAAGKSITWSEDYRLSALKPGDYSIYLCVIDKQSKRRLTILNGIAQEPASNPASLVDLGKVSVSAK